MRRIGLFVDVEVEGHRVIIFPAGIKATLVGHPEPYDPVEMSPQELCHALNTPRRAYKGGKLVECATRTLICSLSEYLGLPTSS